MRVVDERAEVRLLGPRELKAEGRGNALADDAGAVVEDVLEGVVLTVDVRDKVLRTLGEVEYGLEVDDLGVGGAHRGELLGKKLKVLAVQYGKVGHVHSFQRVCVGWCRQLKGRA